MGRRWLRRMLRPCRTSDSSVSASASYGKLRCGDDQAVLRRERKTETDLVCQRGVPAVVQAHRSGVWEFLGQCPRQT